MIFFLLIVKIPEAIFLGMYQFFFYFAIFHCLDILFCVFSFCLFNTFSAAVLMVRSFDRIRKVKLLKTEWGGGGCIS